VTTVAYFVAQIAWKSPEARQAYVEGLNGMVERRGGRFLATSSDFQMAEGKWLPGRFILIEFPTMEALRGWYDSEEYRPLLDLRLKNSGSEAIIVEGNATAPSR
jgi:uncharacterized protein (DUF1330 family)